MSGRDPHLLFVFGTRPEIIKCAPLLREAAERGLPVTVVHTGQHYSRELDEVFFEQLALPAPDHNLEVGSGAHGEQTGEMLAGLEPVVVAEAPDVVVVQGDTNSTLAGAITTCKLPPALAHVEAGLRSFDREMPEEHNRVLADHAADFLFAPTDRAVGHLRDEGLTDGVWQTGNTVVDAVRQHIDIAAAESTVLDDLDLTQGGYVLLTAHRAENVDDQDRLAGILEGAATIAREHGLDCVYPVHPRSRRRIEEFDLDVPAAVHLVDPLSFLDFLLLEDHAALVVTDSGGVQEETAILGTPCVTVRDSTERQETIEVGANRLAGTDPREVARAATAMLDAPTDWPVPYGDGTAAVQILDVLESGERP